MFGWLKNLFTAEKTAVWCFDPGLTALKAMHFRLSDDGSGLVADACEYIEYPKALCRPDADADEFLRQALQQFRANCPIQKTDAVAVALPGVNASMWFGSYPPCEPKKIPEIARHEARQSIPFTLDEVVWGFHRMPGAELVDGFYLGAEVGIFAVKKSFALEALRPFKEAGISVDYVQAAPVALHNFWVFDRLDFSLTQVFNDKNPPPFTVLLASGTRDTQLVIDNGYRLWHRSLPVGGDHFTRQLAKTFALTYNKAEHLKRNPDLQEDPKVVQDALRGVFADFALELQRSLGFHSGLWGNKAKIAGFLGLGDALKTQGLLAALKTDGCDVALLDIFRRLFFDLPEDASFDLADAHRYAVCYGLAIEALGLGQDRGMISVNLCPK